MAISWPVMSIFAEVVCYLGALIGLAGLYLINR